MNRAVRIQFHRLAAAELEQAANWYNARAGERVRQRLRAELARARQLLASEPGLGTPDELGTRRLHLDRFPYTLVYRIEGDTVRVVAFMHQRQRPLYWKWRR